MSALSFVLYYCRFEVDRANLIIDGILLLNRLQEYESNWNVPEYSRTSISKTDWILMGGNQV